MGLPGHRRTSSDKRRRASHFALTKPAITTSKSGATHLSHRAAPGATEYNGHAIHVKGREKKLEKLLGAKAKKSEEKTEEHDHNHEGHSHA